MSNIYEKERIMVSVS